ncbi:GSCOCG00011292001-RA-CDS [Cotesia congregata]|uniref:Uncharacterized protein n=1 Tax=Cotesia congregata TaxID=51543 RepID=A0A8J2MLR8_COTCN|nr:GSCOCG00011292001-RA-CDS [Cotesia congregata]CAG5093209.1 Protein of unknown function [Cotesia congregata]
MTQRKKVVELPTTTDIRRFSIFLDKKIDDNIKLLEQGFSIRAWRDLSEAALIQLQLLNRKRAGELERFELDDYKKMQFIKEGDEGYKSLSKKDKEKAKEYGHIVIQGKLYKGVPLLLSTKVRDGINVVIKHRKDARVSSRNPFVFGIAGYYKDAHLGACNVMRKLSEQCGADNPELLRGTFLRKQIATKCSEMQLDSTTTSKVADYLGHDVTIHKKVYQQRTRADILDMSTILLKAQDPNESRNNSKGSIEMDSTITESDISANPGTYNFNESSDINREIGENNVIDPIVDTSLEEGPKNHKTHDKTKSSNHSTDRKKISRVRWSKDEEKAFTKYFAEYLRTETYPSAIVIRDFKKKYNILPNRDIPALKTKLSNFFKLTPSAKIKMLQSGKNSSFLKQKKNLASNMKRKEMKLKDKAQKLKDSTDNSKVKHHIKYIFDSYIEKSHLPSKKTCDEAKKNDKILEVVSIDYIRNVIRKQIDKKKQ